MSRRRPRGAPRPREASETARRSPALDGEPVPEPRADLATRPARWSGETGSGSMLALAIIGATLALMTAAFLLGVTITATHRARAAADLASLAGAARLLRGADEVTACSVARRVGAENGARVRACEATGAASETGAGERGAQRALGSPGSVRVEAVVRLPAPLTRLGPARSSAVAGSADLQKAAPRGRR